MSSDSSSEIDQNQEQAFNILLEYLEDYLLLVDVSKLNTEWHKKTKKIATRLFGEAEPLAKLMLRAGRELYPKPEDVGYLKIPFNNKQSKEYEAEYQLLLEYRTTTEQCLTNWHNTQLGLLRHESLKPNPLTETGYIISALDRFMHTKKYRIFDSVFVIVLLYIYLHNYNEASKPHEDLMKKYSEDMERCFDVIFSADLTGLTPPEGKTSPLRELSEEEREVKKAEIIAAFREDMTKWFPISEDQV